MQQPERPPVGRTRHGDLTLDQIAEMQPGLGRLMPEVSSRYWVLYYAARGGNWALARHQAGELAGLLRLGATTRPRYAAQLRAFLEGPLAEVRRAIESQDWTAFERAHRQGAEAANAYHRETGHPEIHWTLPRDPPQHLRLTPAEEETL